MNTLISKAFLLSLCSASLATAQNGNGNVDREDGWSVTLVQKHLQSLAVFQGSVEMEGSGVSFAPVPEGGSEFTLWAYRSVAGVGVEEHLVDTEVVGAYLPEGRLWITTPDPYAGPVPRTRIDQGFTVNYEVGGLLTGDEAPLAAKRVLVDHNYAMAVGDIRDSIFGDEEDFSQVFNDRNGLGAYPFPASIIPGDAKQVAGREIFRLYALPDGEVAELELSVAEVQIWPMADATFSGSDGVSVYTVVPKIDVNLVNLYPGSQTWVQYYPGPYVAGTTGTQLPGPSLWAPSEFPLTDETMELTDLDSVLLGNGEWTLEVVTRTPFGVEGITNTTFNINRDLELRGSFQALSE